MNVLDENGGFQTGFLKVLLFHSGASKPIRAGRWGGWWSQAQLLYMSSLNFICRLFLNVQSMVLHTNFIWSSQCCKGVKTDSTISSSSYCYVTNHTETGWHKTTILLCLQILWVRISDRPRRKMLSQSYDVWDFSWEDSKVGNDSMPMARLPCMVSIHRSVCWLGHLHITFPCGLVTWASLYFLIQWQMSS